MAGGIDDFVKQFTGGGSLDIQQISHFFERFASTKPEDQAFDNNALHQGATEYLSNLPQDQFHQTVANSYAQMHPQQQQDMVSSLLGALSAQGVDLNTLASNLGLNSIDPRQMTAEDYAHLADFARREHPQAVQQVISEKPWWVRAMGSPVVMGVMGMIASQMLTNRTSSR